MIDVLTAPVRIKIDGEEKVISFPVALMQLIKSKALQGDAKSLKLILSLIQETNAMAPDEVTRIQIYFIDTLL